VTIAFQGFTMIGFTQPRHTAIQTGYHTMTSRADAQRQFLTALNDCISLAVPPAGAVRSHRFDHKSALAHLMRASYSPAFSRDVRRTLGAAIRDTERKLDKQRNVWKRARIVWDIFDALPEDWDDGAPSHPAIG
jgi:hypothetical protein